MTTTDAPAKPQRATTPATATPPGQRTAPPEPPITGTRLFTPRGRHRRPRPRKVLLVAGGLALAAGALSLVRLTPDSGVAGLGTAEAEPRPDDSGTATDRATNAAATVTVPKVSPSATAALGGTTATPVPGVSLAPAPAATGAPSAPWAAPTTIPEAPNTPGAPAPTATPRPPSATHPGSPRPAPTAPPSHTTPPPAPQPEQPGGPDRPGICVPVVGLCVGSLTEEG
ncbi:hypothetical protein [Streptomyces lincolnensis]|uniref:hypothetical protein n=1 Tax=Streptomyces lincolnensis TaxID=1915 RepID=UPI0037D7B648